MTHRLPTPGSDTGTWGYVLNDFLGVSLDSGGAILTAAITAAGGEVTSNKGAASGYAGLDSSSKISITNIPTGTTSTTVALGNMVGNSRTVTAITGVLTGSAAGNTDYVYYWTGSTAYIFTMPTAVGSTGLYTLKNASSVNQTVQFTSGQNADGSTSLTLTPNTSIDLVSNNTNYMIV
jgi:hypothetical protein